MEQKSTIQNQKILALLKLTRYLTYWKMLGDHILTGCQRMKLT